LTQFGAYGLSTNDEPYRRKQRLAIEDALNNLRFLKKSG
jgi:hypothetical protein